MKQYVYHHVFIKCSAVRRPPSAVRRPSSAVRRPSSAVCRPPSVVRRPPSVVRRPPSAVRRPSSAVCRPPSVVRRPPSAVRPPFIYTRVRWPKFRPNLIVSIILSAFCILNKLRCYKIIYRDFDKTNFLILCYVYKN